MLMGYLNCIYGSWLQPRPALGECGHLVSELDMNIHVLLHSVSQIFFLKGGLSHYTQKEHYVSLNTWP